jgi:lipoprotein-anchoring transpeptidase ErfK/SrfK
MRLAAVAAFVVAATVATMASLGGDGTSTAAKRPASLVHYAPPVRAAFTPGRPVRLRPRELSHYAPVRHPVIARAAPSADAPVVEAVATRTPEGTDNIVEVAGHRADAAGAPWVQVRLVNSRTGWVPRAALGGYGTVSTRLDIDLRALRATLYRDGRAVFSAPIGAGAAGTPTPTGRFYIRNRLSRYRSPVYGPVAFGTSAQSPSVTDWPAGGYVGIHGTDRPDLLPGRVSHGCIRLRNPDILRLAKEMPIGTPVLILAGR